MWDYKLYWKIRSNSLNLKDDIFRFHLLNIGFLVSFKVPSESSNSIVLDKCLAWNYLKVNHILQNSNY